MSGHSKWHSIRHKKGIVDQKRGKIFSRHSKLIEVAARSGGDDPESNPRLRMAIEDAKNDNMPNENIGRAIKKGTGELREGVEMAEVTYEGFGPGGVALLISVVTENKNRSSSSIRNILSKHGGAMGGAGSTAWMFLHKGLIRIVVNEQKEGMTRNDLELIAIDAGAEDINEDGGELEIITASAQLGSVKKTIEEKGIAVSGARLVFLPKEAVKVEDASEAKKILALLDALEEDDDVTDVASNFDIPEELL